MNLLAWVLIALTNTTVVIDINGNVRQLLPGETPGPGEVIVVVGRGATAVSDLDVQLYESESSQRQILLGEDIASVHEMLENGEDPTKESAFATAAGGNEPVKPKLHIQGLSETQTESLIDFVTDNLQEQNETLDKE